MVVSTQDRVMTAAGLAVVPLALSGLAFVFKAPKMGAVLGGLGIAAGVFGAVAPGWFLGKSGSSPLAQKGWPQGYPTGNVFADSSVSWGEVNKSVTEAGGYAYGEEAFAAAPAAKPFSKPLDSGMKLNGFWVMR